MDSSDVGLQLMAGAKTSVELLVPVLGIIAIVAILAFAAYLVGCYVPERRLRRHVARRRERCREAWRMRLAMPGSAECQALRARACDAKIAAAESVDSAELEQAQAHLLRAA